MLTFESSPIRGVGIVVFLVNQRLPPPKYRENVHFRPPPSPPPPVSALHIFLTPCTSKHSKNDPNVKIASVLFLFGRGNCLASCVCRRISGGDLTAAFLYFNTTTAACQNVTRNSHPPAEATLVESIFTRYSQKEVRSTAVMLYSTVVALPGAPHGSISKTNDSKNKKPHRGGGGDVFSTNARYLAHGLDL